MCFTWFFCIIVKTQAVCWHACCASTCKLCVDMQAARRHASCASTCKLCVDMQAVRRHASCASTCKLCIDMQVEHRHARSTWKYVGLSTGAAATCKLNIDMQVEHRHASCASTCKLCVDMQAVRRHASCTSTCKLCIDMQVSSKHKLYMKRHKIYIRPKEEVISQTTSNLINHESLRWTISHPLNRTYDNSYLTWVLLIMSYVFHYMSEIFPNSVSTGTQEWIYGKLLKGFLQTHD
jgi:hypothetical protein